MAIRDTLVLASSSHTRTKPQVLLNSRRHLSLKKKKKTLHKQSFSHLLSFILLSRSLTLTRYINPTHWSWKATRADKISISIKKGRGKKNTHRLTQYMQSEAVFFDDKAFTHGKRGTDTEICRTLLPMWRFLPGNWERVGELQKRFSWRRFQKMSNKKQTKRCN